MAVDFFSDKSNLCISPQQGINAYMENSFYKGFIYLVFSHLCQWVCDFGGVYLGVYLISVSYFVPSVDSLLLNDSAVD